MKMTTKNATIKDVAKRAGVSTATVSRVINKSGYVSKEKEALINEVIREVGFHHNKLARSLSTKRTNMIALMIGDITNPYYPQLTLGVEETANKYDYKVILCNIAGDPEKEKRYINDLMSLRIDAMIIAQSRVEKDYYLNEMKLPIPVVTLDEQIIIPNSDRVLIDHKKGAFDITTYLINAGYERIAHISGPADLLTAQQRADGYFEALENHGRRRLNQLIRKSEYTIEGGREAMNSLLDLQNRPDAVFAANDMIAIGAMDVIKQRHLKIPEDIAVAGFDDILFTRMTEPRLTTVAQPTHQIGAMAMQIIIDRLGNSNDSLEPRTIILQPSISVREST